MLITSLILFLGAALLTFAGVGIVLYLLRYFRVVDVPNQRSNHKVPTPRGAGIALVFIIIPCFCILSFIDTTLNVIYPLILSAFVLSLLSFIDDIKSLSVVVRLSAQLIAVILGVLVAYDGIKEPALLSFLSLPLEMFFMGVAWLWFINLYNFMDGIDGITACESFFITLGIVVLSSFAVITPDYLPYWSSLIAGASIGFYMWNRHPAKIFLGDSGSILLGYVLGFILLSMALNGQVLYALLLPMYYLLDSTITLIKRLFRGEKIWQAHSEHYYQQAVRSGLSHTHTVLIIAVLNAFLVLLAGLAAYLPFSAAYAFVMGLALCGLVLNWFSTYE